MTTNKYTTMSIRFSQEEYNVLEQALDVLRKANQEIDNCTDVDEVRLSDDMDTSLLNRIENELNELCCTIEF
jgi:hypothetical protein